METKNMKVVYTVTERGGKSYWTRIGIATVNRDGSWNWKLDAVPVNPTTLQVRDWEPRDDRPGAPSPQAAHAGSDFGTGGRRARDAEAPLV